MSLAEQIKAELQKLTDPDKAAFLPKFFKAGPGGYAEGDLFIGVTVPNQRAVAKRYFKTASLDELGQLLHSPIHEHRLTALFLLVYRFDKAKSEPEKKEIVSFYLANTQYVNNWDLVDSSAEKILGAYLFDKDRTVLYALAQSGHLWEQRIAVIATYYFIKKHDFGDTFRIVEMLLSHKHDLIHKAAGWMLREVGQRDLTAEIQYLIMNYKKMPRTMLRYAIEKLEPDLRKAFLKGNI